MYQFWQLEVFLQLELGDFTGGGAREGFHDTDFARVLVVSESLLAEAQDFAWIKLCSLDGADEGDGDFAAFLVLFRYHGGFADIGELMQDFFDLARVDIHAAHQQHLFAAIHDENVAVRILLPHVAGVQPVAEQRGGRLLGTIVIPSHDVWAADHDFANFTNG